MINAVLLVLVEECGCESGVFRDVVTGRLLDAGHYEPCAECDAYRTAEAEAEYAAEMAAERWYEDRGADEAYAERQWEDARGVVQFEDAYAAAMEE